MDMVPGGSTLRDDCTTNQSLSCLLVVGVGCQDHEGFGGGSV